MQSTVKRPKILKIVCILGFFSIVFSFLAVFSPSVKRMGDWYPALFGLIVAASFISYIGVWHMKRWGVQLFIVSDFSIAGILFSVLCIFPMLLFYNRMDLNL